MGAYWALIIPILAAIISLVFFHKKVVWWELAIPFAASLIWIFSFKNTVEYAIEIDTEYRGSLITEARYYEYWETYVRKTCTRTYKCGKSTCTTTYDCSYCDEHPAYWTVVDNYGKEWKVDQSYYNSLMKRWKDKPKFFDMHRNINNGGWGCGKDGDMYFVQWDGSILTSEPAVSEHDYQNKVQVSHSAFKMAYISKEKAGKLGLYDYPELYDQYKQEAILGIDSLYPVKQANWVKHHFQYFNGYYGKKKHVKAFVLLFYGKSISTALDQQAYWDGGNDNEVVICIDLDKKTKKLNWVKAFGWCDNKRVMVDLREDIMELGYFNYQGIINAMGNTIDKNYKPKNFHDFDYLEIEMPTWAMWMLYIITIVITIGVFIWAIRNNYKYE